jgi:hypothetical protein
VRKEFGNEIPSRVILGVSCLQEIVLAIRSENILLFVALVHIHRYTWGGRYTEGSNVRKQSLINTIIFTF